MWSFIIKNLKAVKKLYRIGNLKTLIYNTVSKTVCNSAKILEAYEKKNRAFIAIIVQFF